jgi:hypothetical protein
MMTVSIRVEPKTGVAIATCTGLLGSDDARDGVVALWEHPEWPGRAAVWDFRTAKFDLSFMDVRDTALFVLERQPDSPPARVAFVTARDVDFGMARAFEAFRDDPRTELNVFRDFDEALRWARGATEHPPA